MDNGSHESAGSMAISTYHRRVSTQRMIRLWCYVIPSSLLSLTMAHIWQYYWADHNDEACDPLIIAMVTIIITLVAFRWDTVTAHAATIVRLNTGGWVDDLGRKRPTKPIRLYDIELDPYCRMVREALSVLDIAYECYPCPIPLETRDRGGHQRRNGSISNTPTNNINGNRATKRPLDTSTIDLLSSPSPADMDDHDASDSDDDNNDHHQEWNAAKFGMLAQHRHRAHVMEMCGVMALPYLEDDNTGVRISSGPTDYVYTPQQVRQMVGGTYDPATLLTTLNAAGTSSTINNDIIRGGGAVAIVEYLYRSYAHLYVRSTIGDEQQKVGPRKPLPLALRWGIHLSRLASWFRSGQPYGLYALPHPSRRPEDMLELYCYESSPDCRAVREFLCSTGLSYRALVCAQGSVRRPKLIQTLRTFVLPVLIDPNTRTQTVGAHDIIAYIKERYVPPPLMVSRAPSSSLSSSSYASLSYS